MKKKFYDIKGNLAIDANYRVLLSERNVGKSYAVKQYVIEEAYKSDFASKFVYLRRYDRDITASACSKYFGDTPIRKITNGDFEAIVYYRGDFYFANMNPKTYKYDRGPVIGYGMALNNAEHYKSLVYEGVENIIFEEFITDSLYLADEPTQLQELVSTIARERDVNVWLLGNKIDRVCPYFKEWELTNALTQDPGTIDKYTYTHTRSDGTQGETIVTVEQCAVAGSNSSMFFGSAAKSIMGGEWASKEKPHLPQPLETYEKLYEVELRDCGFSFIIDLLMDKKTGGVFTFVYPKTRKYKKVPRVITTEFSTDPLTTANFNVNVKAEALMRTLIKAFKVCFSDNLTGTDFEKVLLTREGGI